MIVEITSTPISVNIWKQDRVILHLNTQESYVYVWTSLHGDYSDPLAIYYADSNGDIYIDMSDYLRTYGSQVSSISIYDGTQYVVNTTIKGLIDPEGVLIPYHSILANGALVIPPSMMICDLDQSAIETAEFYASSGTWSVSGDASLSTDSRSIGQIDGQFTITDGTHTKTITPKAKVCGREYAYVKWVSFTGVERIHVFEVVKSTIEVDGAYDLLEVDNSYHQIKGRKDGFSIKLEGLSPYDYWYYADVLHSSDVQISFDGSTYTRVKVDAKKVTIPDGANFDGKLEIAVNYKRYDAVAM